MEGIGPGTVLGARYALRHRLSQDHDLEHWSAHDATLEREVTLTIVGPQRPNGAGVLDAARRAAGVQDTRLVRILDVGTQNGSAFIVEEAMSGSESLAAILLQGPLPAEEARRIAGETARGLEAAGQRGLHHLRLSPHHVLIAPDGTVRVSGVAVAAAVDGQDEQEPDPATASRRDAVRLVAVVYAALTSRWPLDEEVSGVEPAPRMADGVVAPSEIATGVPGDLDALCRVTLNEATGPLTPGDFASRIAPWPRERVDRDGVEPTLVMQLPGSGDATDDLPAAASQAESTVVDTADTTAPAATTTTAATKAAAAPAAATKAAASTVDSGHGSERPRMPSGLSGQFDDIEPPLPLLPASTALTPGRGQSKLVMLIVASFVGLALFVGYRGLTGMGGGTTLSKPTPKPTVIASAPAVTVPAPPAPQAAATAAGPIAILSATGFDPEGDGKEGNDKAARVYDEDPATSWESSTYATADFGSLKKGLGVLLDLGQPTSVHQVTIDLGSGPADLTVYAATEPSLQGATEMGQASAASGQVKIKADGAMPEAQYVIVWFTTLPPDGGQFRASISEIALS